MTFWEVDILGVDISEVDILGVGILGVDILGRTLSLHTWLVADTIDLILSTRPFFGEGRSWG